MATIKSYTDLEQSRKLAEILPVESSDMCYPPYYIGDEDGDHLYYSLPLLEHKDKCAYNRENKDEYIPCWSFAALINILPIIDVANPFIAKTPDNEYYVVYATLTKEVDSSAIYNNPIDACVDIIKNLHKQNLL